MPFVWYQEAWEDFWDGLLLSRSFAAIIDRPIFMRNIAVTTVMAAAYL